MENGIQYSEHIYWYLVLVSLSQVFGPRDNECSISAQGQITTVAIFTISDIQGAFIILLVSLCVNKIAKCYPCSGWDHNVLLLVCPGEVGGEAGKEGSCFRAWETESLNTKTNNCTIPL